MAHTLLLAGWLYSQRPHEGPSSVGQKRGGLTVTLVAPAHPAAKPALTILTADRPTRPHTKRPQSTTRFAPAQQAPVAPPEPSETSASAPSVDKPPAATGTQAEQPGARFANLFAPIISRPLGRGRWGAPPALTPPPADTAMQREQAIQGTRQALTSRIEALRPQLGATALIGTCEIRVSLERQAAQLDCSDAGDRQRLAGQLQDIVRLQPAVASQAHDTCLMASASDIQWVPCLAGEPTAPP